MTKSLNIFLKARVKEHKDECETAPDTCIDLSGLVVSGRKVAAKAAASKSTARSVIGSVSNRSVSTYLTHSADELSDISAQPATVAPRFTAKLKTAVVNVLGIVGGTAIQAVQQLGQIAIDLTKYIYSAAGGFAVKTAGVAKKIMVRLQPAIDKAVRFTVTVLKVRAVKAAQSVMGVFNVAAQSISRAPRLNMLADVAGYFWRCKPARWSVLGIFVLLPVSGMVAAYAVTDLRPQSDIYRTQSIMEELAPIYVESGVLQGGYWVQEAVESGDMLTDILRRMGVSQENIREISALNLLNLNMVQLRDQSVSVRFDVSGDITDVQFFNDDGNGFLNLVALEKVRGQWRRLASPVEMETIPTLRAVKVDTSVKDALIQADVPVEIRESLNEIFSGIVNINKLSQGDTVRLLYNSMYFRGQQMATGDILSAEVVRGDKVYQAYYYSQGKGDQESGSYYDQNGQSLRSYKGFNIKPLERLRVSSPYGMRVHPVLRVVKMHTGIDYAAPKGTPIRVTADGVVKFKGWKGGYGKTVIVQHDNGIETLYAHMSKFSGAKGAVKIGDVIGYVGSTGRSTGPHLHYEVRKNGRHMNPTATALPTPKLMPDNMADFSRKQKLYAATMAAVHGLPVTVAQLD